jgi:predicted dehydrogenase
VSVLRIAIIGCGKIADQHVLAMQRVPNCKLVAVCDRERLMAEQLAERFEVDGCFSDARELLEASSPDVVHITTPPQSHFQLGRQCLEFGSHVYLEKPFTVTADEAILLTQLAQERNLKITAGHNLQFTPEMLKMRRLVAQGFLGGKPVHLESYWSYNLGDLSYVGPVLGNRSHWVRQLPGQLFHNIISHGIAKLTEFLDDSLSVVVATAHQSPQIRLFGAEEVLDELRVSIQDANGTTAFFCFSTQIKGINQLRVYGPENSMVADIITGSLVRTKGRAYKSYLTYVIPSFNEAWEHLKNASLNLSDFIRRRLYQDFGMKELIERFYKSIAEQELPPIPYREIILTARIMDEIFAQIYSGKKPVNHRGTGGVVVDDFTLASDRLKTAEPEALHSKGDR